MSKILDNAFVSINGVDISHSINSITLGLDNEGQDATTMGDKTRNEIAGLKVISCSLDMNQDFASGGLDETLFNLFDAKTIFEVIIRPENEAVSTSNPNFKFRAFIKSYPILGGGAGDKAATSIELAPAKDGVNAPDLTRTTS